MRSKSLYSILKTASEIGKEFEKINRTLRKLESSLKLHLLMKNLNYKSLKHLLNFLKIRMLKN